MPNIIGPHSGPKDLLLTYAQRVGAKRIDEVKRFIEQLYAQNYVDGFMTAIQSIHETDAWQYSYWVNNLNPGGLAITFSGQSSKTWANGTDAARAMLVHEVAYSGAALPKEWSAWTALDPHYKEVFSEGLAGSATKFSDYGNGKWGTDPNYQTGMRNREAEVRALATTTSPVTAQGGTDVSVPTPRIIDKFLHVSQDGYAGVERRIRGRFGMAPKIIVLHIQEGSNSGSWQHFHSVSASSTVLIGKNGDIWRLVPEEDGPWTNGDVNQPSALGREVIDKWGADPNVYTLSIETEGFTGEWPKTQAQLNSVVWQVKQWMTKYGIPVHYVLKHADINNVDRHYCPGDAFYNYVIAAVQNVDVKDVLATPSPITVDSKPWDGKQNVSVNGVLFVGEPHAQITLAKAASAYLYASTESAVTHKYKAGEKIAVLGWVTGAKVQGDTKWWITKDFGRLPADRTVEKPNQVPVPPKPPTEEQADLPKGAKLYKGVIHYLVSSDERELDVIANANLREEASTASKVVGSVHKGDKVKAIYWCFGDLTRKERVWWVLEHPEDTLRKGGRLYANATASRPD